ncbi:hypothetical protein, partial [Prosthecobacter sp.]|uniref:hypothetical protein n=1 Tax=Prosthecobacter sp. TaxID=1965333 RepID=UPI00248898F8
MRAALLGARNLFRCTPQHTPAPLWHSTFATPSVTVFAAFGESHHTSHADDLLRTKVSRSVTLFGFVSEGDDFFDAPR